MGSRGESSAELAQRLGISKDRLYQFLEREGITPKARRPRGRTLSSSIAAARLAPPGSDAEMMIGAIQRMLNSVLEEIAQLRSQLAEYEKRYGPSMTDALEPRIGEPSSIRGRSGHNPEKTRN